MASKNRSDLKSYFVKNAIPTEGNFADLIDSQLNQAQDGVFKPDLDALSVVAASGDQKRVLRLFASYPATNPDWMISLNPAQDPTKAGTNKPGFAITDGTGKTRLFIDAATGQIGVGTNTPQVALDVTGIVQATGFRANGSLLISRDVSSQLGPTLTLQNNSGGTGAGGAIDFNGYDPGTNDPTLRIQSINDGGSSSHLTFSTKKPGANTNTLVERLRLTSDGLLQFSNDSPKDKIVIYDAGARMGLGLNAANINLFYPANATFSLRVNSYSGTEVFSVSGSGDVAAQGRSLTVKGKGNEQCYLGGDGGGNDVEIGSANSNIMILSAWNPSAGSGMDFHCRSLTQTSDARLKDNIQPITGALERIVHLYGVSFDWKVDNRPEGAPKHLGLIAQQVREVVPEAVVDAKEGSLSITYNAITALLVEAVKEQQKHIDELRAALTLAPAC